MWHSPERGIGSPSRPGVDADGKPTAVLVQERVKRLDPLGLVGLEACVQPDDRHHRRAIEGLRDALDLRQAAFDAAGTRHQEGVQQHHPPPQAFKAEGSSVLSHGVISHS